MFWRENASLFRVLSKHFDFWDQKIKVTRNFMKPKGSSWKTGSFHIKHPSEIMATQVATLFGYFEQML
jgi:hypothetical protein